MDLTELRRFRRAYWRAMYELDTARLRQWEQSRVTLPQLRVLDQIRRTPGIVTGELSRALGITVSTTSGLVGKLVERGLVQRTTAPTDRRQVPLHLTEAGAAIAGELSDVGRSFLDQVAAALGPDLGAVTTRLEQLGAVAGGVRAAESVRAEDAASPLDREAANV